MPPAGSLVVSPPQIARSRESSADQAIVEQMAKQAVEGAFVTNGLVYEKHEEASNDAQIYKRAVARAKQVPDHKMRSRVWGMTKDGKVELDTDKKAEWQFAVKYDPNREKSTRAKASSS